MFSLLRLVRAGYFTALLVVVVALALPNPSKGQKSFRPHGLPGRPNSLGGVGTAKNPGNPGTIGTPGSSQIMRGNNLGKGGALGSPGAVGVAGTRTQAQGGGARGIAGSAPIRGVGR